MREQLTGRKQSDREKTNNSSSEESNDPQTLPNNEQYEFTLYLEEVPIALWIEDFSFAYEFISHLDIRSPSKMEEYFVNNPNAYETVLKGIKILHTNATAKKIRNSSKNADRLYELVSQDSMHTIIDQLWAIKKREKSIISEISGYAGKKSAYYLLKWKVMPGYEDSYKKVMVTLTDITSWKSTEIMLKESKRQMSTLLNNLRG